jgi:hypothetical protein
MACSHLVGDGAEVSCVTHLEVADLHSRCPYGR